MSLDFVPDDMIALVFSKLDVRSLHRMRAVNKRMYAIKPIVKNNLEEIRLEVDDSGSGKLTVKEQGFGMVTIQQRDDNELEHSLYRLTVNTHVKKITLKDENSKVGAINKLLDIEADELEVNTICRANGQTINNLFILSSLAKRYRKISLYKACSHIDPSQEDLRHIRQMMIDGSCNLEDVEINIQGEVAAFMKEYCGVACECYKTGQGKLSMIFDAEEEFVRAEQTFIDHSDLVLCHIHGNLKTTLSLGHIRIEKCKDGAKPDVNFSKLTLGHEYVSTI